MIQLLNSCSWKWYKLTEVLIEVLIDEYCVQGSCKKSSSCAEWQHCSDIFRYMPETM